MAKAATKKKRARTRPDDLTIATALERARLKRLVNAKREIARLVNELRRVSVKTDAAVLEFALDVRDARDEDEVNERESARAAETVGA